MTGVGVAPDDDERQAARAAVRMAERVLVLRADDLGDNILASGFVTTLDQSIPADCGFIGTPGALELMDTRGLAFVSGVDCRPRSHLDVLRRGLRLRQEIDRFDPDVVILPRFDFEREALAVALVGPRPRTTITWARSTTPKRARRNWWLRTLPGARLFPAGGAQHEFARLQALADFIGIDPSALAPCLSPDLLRWPTPPAAVTKVAEAGKPMVAMGIGAAQARRWWPPQRFASVIAELGEAGYVSVLVGSPNEQPLGRQVLDNLPSNAPVVDLVGKLPITDTARLIARCTLFVGNDSGLGHVAAALGVATVTISCHPLTGAPDHVNAPERYHPVGSRGLVVRPRRPTSSRCADGCVPVDEPCCITNVPVDDVLQACRALLTAADPTDGDPTDGDPTPGDATAGDRFVPDRDTEL